MGFKSLEREEQVNNLISSCEDRVPFPDYAETDVDEDWNPSNRVTPEMFDQLFRMF